ncbi:MAG: hypothetical protein HKO93_01715, partial [Flavobacteriales bacterium]|nr:hypothetical protein [Flavobacteriales bacterium]
MQKSFDIALVLDRQTEEQFLEVPSYIYKNDPNWIPHLKQDIEKIFDEKQNKLLRDGKANRWILYDESKKAVGRIAAFINAKTSYTFDQPTGGIGFFECTDDQEMADALFNKAKAWLEENSMEAMDGPINFGDKNQFWGLLVENFDSPNSYAMNYNPPYYRKLFENYGFKTYYEQYVYWRNIRQPVEPVFVRKFESVKSNYNVEVRDATKMSLEQIASDFRTVYNGAWGGHENFKMMSESAAMKVAKSLKPIMDKRIVVFAYAEDIPVGFYINIPELNEIFCYVNGNLNWMGKLKFLYHKWRKTPRTMVGIVFGVVKEWQGKGIEGAMITWFGYHQVPKLNYDSTILTWIGDFNPKMIKVATNLGTTVHRTYI